MIYSRMYYDINKLFVCNLKKLGTELDVDQQRKKYIIWRLDGDMGYECLAGRYSCIFTEAITDYQVGAIRSQTPIVDPPADTDVIFNATSIDMAFFTEEEKKSGYVTDLRLMQIYSQMNFYQQLPQEQTETASLQQLVELLVEDPSHFYKAIAQDLTPKERMYIISILENKSCMNCQNGCCNVEHHEKIGLDETGMPQGHGCIGWENDELVGRSKILKNNDIYRIEKI